MRHISTLIISLLCISSFAQTYDSLSVEDKDTVPNIFKDSPAITGLAVSFDYTKLATLFLKDRSQWEGGIEVIFKRKILLSLEGGYARYTPNFANAEQNLFHEYAYKNALYYISKGFYGRGGIDFLFKSDRINNIYMGLHYGVSFFEDSAEYEVSSTLFNDYMKQYSHSNVNAHWIEANIGSDIQVFNNFFLGIVFRLRFLAKNSAKNDNIEVYYIPGYGKALNAVVPAVNLHVKYRFLNQ